MHTVYYTIILLSVYHVFVFVSDFVTVPSPRVLIVTMEERHVYMCNHSETINIFWRVNGSILNFEIFLIEVAIAALQLPGGGRVSTLTIGGRLRHNATTIQCSARLSDGFIVTTPSVLFLMQGITCYKISIVRSAKSLQTRIVSLGRQQRSKVVPHH